MEARTDIKHRRSLGGSFLMTGLIATVIAVAVWANLWKADLRVAAVQVSGNSIVKDGEILLLANIKKEQKLYAVDLLAAQKRILQNAFVKSVAVNRDAPNRISITVEEREPIVAIILDNMKYLDAEGVVLPPARSENIFDIPVLTGAFQQGEFSPGKQIARADVREALEILAAARELGDELYRRISEVHVEGANDIILYTAESGVPVVFGHGNVGAKLVKFDGFWKEIVPHHGARELAYVDLRFEDQVVVRWNHETEEARPAKNVAEKVLKPIKS